MEETDLKTFIRRYLRAWPLLVLSFLALSSLAIILIVSVQPSYPGRTSILIATPMRHDDPNRLVQPQEVYAKTDKNYYLNEQLRITSQPVLANVVDRLGLAIKHVQANTLFDWDVYGNSPIRAELDSASAKAAARVPYGVTFYLRQVNGDKFTLVGSGKYGPDQTPIEVEQEANFGEWIQLDSARVRITRTTGNVPPLEGAEAKEYGFILFDRRAATLELMDAVTGEPALAEATTVNVSYTGAPQKKVLDVLAAIGDAYVAMHLAEQRLDLERTISKLQAEIGSNAKQLASTSDQLEQFRREENVTNMEHATVLLQEAMKSLDSEKEALLVQAAYYEQLAKTLGSNDAAKPISPKAFGISDPLLNDMTSQYAALQSDISVLRDEGKSANPNYNRLVRLLHQQRDNILATVQNFKASTQISLDNVEQRRKNLLVQQGAIPQLDRKLTDRLRDQEMYAQVNKELMARLSNLRVQHAALSPEVLVATPAYLTSLKPAFPNPVILFAAVVLLALMAPVVLLIARALVGGKFQGTASLQQVFPGTVPAAQIPFSSHPGVDGFAAATDSAAYTELSKLAALLEQLRGDGPQAVLVCGASGTEAVGTTTGRLAHVLAARGNTVFWSSTLAQRSMAAAGPVAVAPGTPMAGLRAMAGQSGGFVVIEGSSADQLAALPPTEHADRALILCQPGVTDNGDLKKLAVSMANGQLPPLLFVSIEVMDRALPWWGLGKSGNERRLGPLEWLRYNWIRAWR